MPIPSRSASSKAIPALSCRRRMRCRKASTLCQAARQGFAGRGEDRAVEARRHLQSEGRQTVGARAHRPRLYEGDDGDHPVASCRRRGPLTAEAKVPLALTNAAGVSLTRISPYHAHFVHLVAAGLPDQQMAAEQGWKPGYPERSPTSSPAMIPRRLFGGFRAVSLADPGQRGRGPRLNSRHFDCRCRTDVQFC